MDAFYASVEQRDRPELRGKAVIVGGDAKSRGVVSAASYEARKFGVHSAMPMAQAVRLCPQGIVLPVRMDRYAEVSHVIQTLFERYTPLVEPISLDEAFLDVTDSVNLFGPAEQIGRRIKEQIREQTQLTASVGVAPNKFLAKLASDLRKPDGFVVITEQNKQEILDPLPVGKIWGVGKVTEATLQSSAFAPSPSFAPARARNSSPLWATPPRNCCGSHAARTTDRSSRTGSARASPASRPSRRTSAMSRS